MITMGAVYVITEYLPALPEAGLEQRLEWEATVEVICFHFIYDI